MAEGKHFVDKYRAELIRRVSSVVPILDELFQRGVLSRQHYDYIRTQRTSQDKMRALYSTRLEADTNWKDVFYKVLEENEPYLIADFKGEKGENVLDKVQVETMTAKKMLCETLNDLSSEELERFKSLIELEKGFPLFSRRQQEVRNTQDVVELMVETYSQECVELTKKMLKKMNRTDLVQRFSGISSGTEEKQWPSLIQRVETMTSVIELLLETLRDLSDRELQMFEEILSQIHFNISQYSVFPSMQPKTTDIQDTVFEMVQTYGQKSLEKTKIVLQQMKKTDLVQRLSASSSGPKKKHSVDEPLSALIHKVATVVAVRDLLLETFSDLSDEELKNCKWFLQFTLFQRSLQQTSGRRLLWADRAKELVDVVIRAFGQQSVEVSREVFMDMNRTDLVQRLSETSSGPEEKHSEDEHWPALIQKVEMMRSVIELLLETLKDLSKRELQTFEDILSPDPFNIHYPVLPLRQLKTADIQDTVFEMVQTYGEKSLEETKIVFQQMNRTDLVQRLSASSSGSKNDRRSALIQRVATIAAVKQLLLETLKDLSSKKLEEFKRLHKLICCQKKLPDISWMLRVTGTRAAIVDHMVETYGQQSVEVTREVFMCMNRIDLVQKLSKPSSELKERNSVDEHLRALLEREATMTSLQKRLLQTLEDFSDGDLDEFKHVLQYTEIKEGLPKIPGRRMELAGRAEIVKLMEEIYGQESVEVTREVLKTMNRRDLLQRLSDISSGSKGPERSLELEGCGSVKQDSSDWTKLEPEVSSTDADELPTYSLQSERGSFECSVSGLRWDSKEKVSFKYQFCSWEEPMERMENIQYMPAGPLMDITVTAGKFEEVYLPHWICIDDNPKISNNFAVLHIDDCGDVVEKVSEVTPSHVKLAEPIFSPRAALMKVGLPVKIKCNILIYYKPNTSFLKLHVYLVPQDPGLQQTLDKKKSSKGYKRIEKSDPDKYLKMQKGFILTADIDTAEILPKVITLRYDSQDPNFYEVFIESPDRDFHLILSQKNKGETQGEPVWCCAIRKDDYQTSARFEAAESSTGLCYGATARERHSVEEQLSTQLQKALTIPTDRKRLWYTLGYLKEEEFKEFKWFLQDRDVLEGLPCIPRSRLQKGDMLDLVDLMLQTYSQQSVELTKKVFRKINRNDLVEML